MTLQFQAQTYIRGEMQIGRGRKLKQEPRLG